MVSTSLLLFNFGFHMVTSDIYLNGSSNYLKNNQPFTLTCRSDDVPVGNTAVFFKDGINNYNVIYANKCFGIPQQPGGTTVECTNTCSCSGNLKTYTLTQTDTYSSNSVTFRCEMRIGSTSNVITKDINVDVACRYSSKCNKCRVDLYYTPHHHSLYSEDGPSSVSLNPSTTPITVNEGQQVGPITCTAECVPDCIYRWSGPEVTGNISVLQIMNIQQSRDGTYTCTATNACGSSTVDVDVVVQYGPDDIVLNPTNQTYIIKENQSVGPVTCTSSCNPICTYQWTGPGIQQTPNQLYITQIKRGQTGRFTCTANNAVSNIQKEISITVLYGPSSVSLNPSTTPITVNEGQQVGPITCTADCVPDCTYRWSGPEVTGDISVLQIMNIQQSRDGTYTCTATNAYGSSTVDVDVVVQYGPDDIVLNPTDQTYKIKENQSVGPVTCTSSCNPICTYQWTGPGIPQTPNQLHITQIKRGQTGNFTCSANNAVSNIQKQISITVQYGPSSVSLNPSTTAITVNEGQQVGPITCTADCVPDCTYRWRGPEVTENISVLQISNIQRSRNGTYTCTATNTYGSSKVDVDVVVQYGPDDIDLNPTNQTYRIEENQSVGPVTCTSSCHPVCSYQWTGPGITQTSNKLYINQIKRLHTGQFTCTASNDVSSVQKHISITVQYGPSSVSLDPSTTPITVNEEQHVGPITCTADCVPDCTYRWSGPEVTGDISVLQINNIYRSRNGTYTCTATNTYGSSNVDVDVVVQYGPDDIDLKPTNQTYTIEENQSVGPVTCTSSCHPVCSYQWTGPGITQTQNQLYIIQIKRGDTGQFTCTASNVLGSVQTHISITVQYAATVYLSADLYEAHENSSITLTCGADGVPIPTLTLYFTDTLGSRHELLAITNTTSQYQISTAKCNDTGTYLCKADNGFHFTSNISKDVNVTCPPRLNRDCSSESLIYVKNDVYTGISVCLISNPMPRINWTAINDTYKIYHNTSFYKNSSILYTSVLETTLAGRSYLQYSFIAENSFGKTDVEEFTLELKDKPYKPTHVYVSCQKMNTVFWTSNFNGGSDQRFTIVHFENNITNFSFPDIEDDGMHANMSFDIEKLQPNTQYAFLVIARNELGKTQSDTVYCVTSEIPRVTETNMSAIIGGASGSALAVLLIAVGISGYLYRRRKKSRSDKEMELLNKSHMRDTDDIDDGLRDNILYVSADTVSTSAKEGPVYSQVNKQQTGNTSKQGDTSTIYSVVDKSKAKKPETKKGQKKPNDVKINNDVYENFSAKKDNQHAPKKALGEDMHTNFTEGPGEANKKRNKDGLVYADLVFENNPSGRKFVIRGLENRTGYADVDFTKKADPLPSDDSDDEVKAKMPQNKDTQYTENN